MGISHLEPLAGPKYLDICREVEARIEAGALKPGDRLPSFLKLREQYGATPATVERVLGTLEKKGLIRREARRGIFVTLPPARTLKGVIGLLSYPHFDANPYYSVLYNGVHRAAHALGLDVLSINEYSAAACAKIDGLLVTHLPAAPDDFSVELPIVSMMSIFYRLPSVGADDRGGTELAIEHLLGLGHRRIGFLTVGNLPEDSHGYANSDFASRQRFEAYHEVMRRNGIVPDPSWVRPLIDDLTVFPGYMAAGREKMQRWLEDNWTKLGLTALLTQNDEVAIQVVQVLEEAGYKVPQQISVVGFDDTAICNMIRPRLTSVNASLDGVGAKAVGMLMEQIADRSRPREKYPVPVMLPTKLVVRESTGPCAHANAVQAAKPCAQVQPRDLNINKLERGIQ